MWSTTYVHALITYSLLYISNAVNCWPSSSGNETYVSIEYEASSMFDLRNVVISVPLPALREAPSVSQIDGEWRCVICCFSFSEQLLGTAMVFVFWVEVWYK